jgi:hypothetical protein
MSVFIPAMFLLCLTLDPLVPPLPIVAATIFPLVTWFEDIFRVKKRDEGKKRGNRTNKWLLTMLVQVAKRERSWLYNRSVEGKFC